MRVELTSAAERELDEAVAWYDARRHLLGDEFYDAVLKALTAIEADPQRFPIHEHAPPGREIRRHRLTRFPYTVVYEIAGNVAYVLAIAHGSRRPGYWKRRQK